MLRPSRSSLFVPGNRAADREGGDQGAREEGAGRQREGQRLRDRADSRRPRGRGVPRAGQRHAAEGRDAGGHARARRDARAAGVPYPTISSWWNIKDLEGLERDATWNRQLGYRGQTVMHPTHVPIVNAVFTPSADEIAFHRGLIEAMEEAQRRGIAAVTYKGDMVDEAMLKTSRELLDFARSIGLQA